MLSMQASSALSAPSVHPLVTASFADDTVRNPFPAKEKHTLYEIAASYQRPTATYAKDGWLCHQCREWVWNVDLVSPRHQISQR